MKKLAIALAFLVIAHPASAQQQRPTVDQVQIQVLENEANGHRQTIAQLAVKINELTDQITALKTKCGKTCEAEPAK